MPPSITGIIVEYGNGTISDVSRNFKDFCVFLTGFIIWEPSLLQPRRDDFFPHKMSIRLSDSGRCCFWVFSNRSVLQEVEGELPL